MKIGDLIVKMALGPSGRVTQSIRLDLAMPILLAGQQVQKPEPTMGGTARNHLNALPGNPRRDRPKGRQEGQFLQKIQ